MERSINANLSTQSLTFRPGGPPVSFNVTVVNDSDQFASFQLEVIAAGADRNSGVRWYQLSPEVSAAKPPGSTTQFRIVITETPLPGFVGTVNLTTRVSSPQLRQERKLLVRLTIEAGAAPTLLSIDLPVNPLQVYPRNTVDILVRVRNLGQQPADVLLRITGLNPAWLNNRTEQRLQVNPTNQAETTFQCQPSAANQAPSQPYSFIIECFSRDEPPASAEGRLEVLPVGFLEFTAEPQQQTIPSHRGRWLVDWKSNSATFNLCFKNASNLYQQVSVQLQGRDQKKCIYKLPESVEVGLGETLKLPLEVSTKRSWLGWTKTLQLEAKALLSDQRLGSPDPTTKALELKVQPVIPWWLLLAVLALMLALTMLLFRPAPLHTDIVKTVLFSGGDSSLVVSGSHDCTIRIWDVDSNHLQPKSPFKDPEKACGKRPNPQGLLAVTGQPIWTLQFIPKDNDRLAVGLDNGTIQLWNVPRRKQEYGLNMDDPTNDRVFDLLFTSNSLRLFSGHGSGKVRIWERSSSVAKFENVPQVLDLGKRLRYPIYALALSRDEKTLVVAGGSKRIFLWNQTDFSSNPRQLLAPQLDGGENDYIYALAFTPQEFPELLATADSNGYIGIWDLEPCKTIKNSTQVCRAALRDRWQAAESSIRSLTFSSSSPLQLVSAGDDGRIVVWSLTSEGKLDKTVVNGREIYQSSKEINSIALAEDNHGLIVVSGGDDFQVKLHRLK
jgi:WD40 repeat protein